ncbi:MAG: hypothetical protein IJ705_02420 [Oscillospiraceae bacterium]|nr:hypothetical protein [Oscillospiraceae bacterium]
MRENKTALAVRCMDVLCKHVGVLEAENFILYLRSEAFDYTKWQREYYNSMTPEMVRAGIVRNAEEHPFQGEKAVIL